VSGQVIRCVVGGRVQGVYYRASTAEHAQRLKLDGWVKNLADGRVEIVVSGDSVAVAELVRWLWQGPPAARVESVLLEEWNEPVASGFAVLRQP
jgi:acylphosphatase